MTLADAEKAYQKDFGLHAGKQNQSRGSVGNWIDYFVCEGVWVKLMWK